MDLFQRKIESITPPAVGTNGRMAIGANDGQHRATSVDSILTTVHGIDSGRRASIRGDTS